jgi:hypothetical protein
MNDELTVEEMLAAADEPTSDTLSAKLGTIRQRASDADVSVTVDLHGKLVALTIDPKTLTQRPDALATTIKRLTDQAAAAALSAGIAVLTDSLQDSALIADLTTQLGHS